MTAPTSPEVIWECKIGGPVPGEMPNGWDSPMRRAVQAAFLSLTGVDAEFTFSGRGQLTEMERAVVEKRAPTSPASGALPAGKRDIYALAALLPEGVSWHDPITPNIAAHIAALASREASSDVMVDMVPPATARDRWMYEQGRLAERDPRTPKAAAPVPSPAPLTDGQIIDLANKALPGWKRKDNDLAYIQVVRAALASPQVAPAPVAMVVHRTIGPGHDTPARTTFDVQWLTIDPFKWSGPLYARPLAAPAPVAPTDPGIQHMADQAGDIDRERLSLWLTALGIAGPSGDENMLASIGRWVNEVLRCEPFAPAAPALDQLVSTITWDDGKQDTIEVFGTEKNLRRMKAYLESKAAPVAPTPAQPSKTVPCEDCEGRGVVGEPVYQGAFQPPEHETCSSCDGSGVWQIAPRPAQPIQDKNRSRFVSIHEVRLLALPTPSQEGQQP